MKKPPPIEESLRSRQEAFVQSSREAFERWLHSPKPATSVSWVEAVGFLILTFLGRCILVGLPIYVGCCSSLFVMAVFSSHSDALFRIGLPVAEKATLYLSPVGAAVWSAFSVYRSFRH
jgi:hypothetical protein